MKKYLLFFAVIFTAGAAYAQDDASRTIDQQDTIVFDLSQQTSTSGHIQFPIYIATDDTINALDFSFSYNTVDFKFDSIIDLTNLNPVYNEVSGATDTTVLLTSFSLQPIAHHTNLVMARFTILTAGPMCFEDLDSVLVYLNGNACRAYVTNCSTVGIEEQSNDNSISGIYPNPAAESATVEFSLGAPVNVSISVYDVTGKRVFETNPAAYSRGSHKLNLNLSGLENGVYFIRINSENETKSARISVIR